MITYTNYPSVCAVLGVALFLFQWYILANTYTIDTGIPDRFKVDFSNALKLKIPTYILFLMFFLCFIPVANLIESIIFVCIYTKYYNGLESYNCKNKYTYWIYRGYL